MGRRGDEPIALYRLYAAENVLLYLGISRNPEFRLQEHRIDKEWFHLIHRRTEEWFPDRSAAEAAEKAATAAEKPLHDCSWRRTQTGERPQWRDAEGASRVTAGLTQEIEQGVLKPGQLLRVGQTAARFNVAPATASRAMRDLTQAGLLRHASKFYVMPIAQRSNDG